MIQDLGPVDGLPGRDGAPARPTLISLFDETPLRRRILFENPLGTAYTQRSIEFSFGTPYITNASNQYWQRSRILAYIDNNDTVSYVNVPARYRTMTPRRLTVPAYDFLSVDITMDSGTWNFVVVPVVFDPVDFQIYYASALISSNPMSGSTYRIVVEMRITSPNASADYILDPNPRDIWLYGFSDSSFAS